MIFALLMISQNLILNCILGEIGSIWYHGQYYREDQGVCGSTGQMQAPNRLRRVQDRGGDAEDPKYVYKIGCSSSLISTFG